MPGNKKVPAPLPDVPVAPTILCVGEFDIHFTPVSRSEGDTEGVLIMFGPPGASRRPFATHGAASSKSIRDRGGAATAARSRK